MDSIIAAYTPLDLTTIQKSLPKGLRKINTDKDLETEVQDIAANLKDITTDWKKRTDACLRIQALAYLFDAVCSGELSRINIQHYLAQMNKLHASLAVQIHDLRSMSAKSAHNAIQVLAQSFGNDFETLALKLVTKDSLIKVLHSGNKTLADHAHQSVLGILNHVCVPKLISRLQSEMANSKSPMAHAKMAQYIYVLVSIYPFEGVLDKNANAVDSYIQQCVSNANSDARVAGRKSFLIWQKLAPENAQNLFAMLDYQVQKAIIEEQDKQGGQEAGYFPPSSSYPPPKQAANRSSFPGGGQSQAASSTNASNTFGNSLGSNQEPKQKRPISSNTRRSGKATSKGSVSRGSRAGNTSQNRQSLGVVSQNSAEQMNIAQSKYAMDPHSPGLHIVSSQSRKSEKTSSYVIAEDDAQKPGINNGAIDFYQHDDNYDVVDDDAQDSGRHRADEEMEIEPVLGQGQQFQQVQQFSYVKIQKMLRSAKWSQRAQALEDFLRYLIEMQPNELMNQLKTEPDFATIVELVIQKLDGETVIRILEISLDLIELLLSSLPECLIANINDVIICFLKQLSSRREMISEKANDLINLARETLGADFLLPHFISILDEMAADPQQIKTKISALEVLNVLIKESESLDNNSENYPQYVAVVKSLGNVIKQHSSQRSIVNPVIGAILSLRDKNMETTFKAIVEELSQTQYTILKQLLNAHERTLARQLLEYQEQVSATQEQVSYQQQQQIQEQNSQQPGYGNARGGVGKYQNPYLMQGPGQEQPQMQKQTPEVIPKRTGSTRPDSAKRSAGASRGYGNNSRSGAGSQAQAQASGMTPSQIPKSQQMNQRVSYNQAQQNQQPATGKQPQIIGLDTFKPQQVMNMSSQQDFLMQQCQVLVNVGKTNQMDTNPQVVSQALKNIQDTIVTIDKGDRATQQLIFQNLETLIDSLLYIIQLSTSSTVKPQQHHLVLQQNNIRNTCIELLTHIIKQSHRSANAQNLEAYRDDILIATLKAYSPDIAPQHQCITNQVAEDLLEQLIISCDIDFISQTIEPLLRTEQPPRLQALMRMIQNKLKNIQKQQLNTLSSKQVQKLIENLVSLSDVLGAQMSNNNADVRKGVVFCMVEVYFTLQEDEIFQEVFMDKLNQSQQKLVDIYITRKKSMDEQKQNNEQQQ